MILTEPDNLLLVLEFFLQHLLFLPEQTNSSTKSPRHSYQRTITMSTASIISFTSTGDLHPAPSHPQLNDSSSPPPRPKSFDRFVHHHFSCGHVCRANPYHRSGFYIPINWKRDIPCPGCMQKMPMDYILERKWETSIRYKTKAWFRRLFKNRIQVVDSVEWQWSE